MLILLIICYIISVFISYMFIRQVLIIEGEYKSKNEPYGFLIFLILIPGFNIMVSFVGFISVYNPKINYKKFFRIK